MIGYEGTTIREMGKHDGCGGDVYMWEDCVLGCQRCGAHLTFTPPPPRPTDSVETTCYARPEETVPEAPAEQGVMPAVPVFEGGIQRQIDSVLMDGFGCRDRSDLPDPGDQDE
jgi:hypothetical protein